MMDGGIYKIVCSVNNNFYIGSAKNFIIRKTQHFNLLKRNKHPNPHLQYAFNKYKEDNFVWEILEYCEKDNLIEREQYFIDTLLPEYNICKIAGSVMSGRKHKEESKKKIGEAQIGEKNHNFGNKIITKSILLFDTKNNFFMVFNNMTRCAEFLSNEFEKKIYKQTLCSIIKGRLTKYKYLKNYNFEMLQGV